MKLTLKAQNAAIDILRNVAELNRKEAAKRSRAYYRKHRKEIRARQSKWRKENRKTYLESQQKYNQKRRKK